MAPASMLNNVRIRFDKSVIDRKDWIKYLQVVNWHVEQLGDVITAAPSASFTKYIEAQVQDYLAGKKVSARIQPAIMNIADDVLAGRAVTVRAGDYVALQSEFKAK